MSESSAIEFSKKGYVRVDGMASSAVTQLIFDHALRRSRSSKDSGVSDAFVPNVPSFYGDYLIEGLLETLRPHMEAVTGKKLYPTYSFFRVYRAGDRLPRHTDRGACEISVTLMLGSESDEDWPIYMQNGANDPVPIVLRPGDGAVYRGCDVDHWRDQLTSGVHAQAFLHYVEKGGPLESYRYDQRWATGLRPSKIKLTTNWEKLCNRARHIPVRLWQGVLICLQKIGSRRVT